VIVFRDSLGQLLPQGLARLQVDIFRDDLVDSWKSINNREVRSMARGEITLGLKSLSEKQTEATYFIVVAVNGVPLQQCPYRLQSVRPAAALSVPASSI
jgi:hypothetical protein